MVFPPLASSRCAWHLPFFASLLLLGSASLADPPAGSSVWLRADLGLAVDGQGGVERWADQSGNGNDFEQSVEAKRPIADPSGFIVGERSAVKLARIVNGNRTYGGSLGMDFVVNEATEIRQLGTLDHLRDGIVGQITVQIWRRNDGGTPATPNDDSGDVVLDQAIFTNASPGELEGSQRWKTLANPLVLGPGAYSIVSWGYSGADRYYGNGGPTGGVAPGIQIVGVPRFGGTAGAFPTTLASGVAHLYSGAGAMKVRVPGGAVTERAAVRFDGVDDGLQGAESMNIGRPSSVFVMLEREDGSNGIVIQNSSGLGWEIQHDRFSIGSSWLRQRDLPQFQPLMVGMINGDDETRGFLNGADWTHFPQLINSSPGRLALGGGSGRRNDPIAAKIAEVLVYERALSEADRWQLEDYWADRYGIEAGAAVRRPTISPVGDVGTGEVNVTMAVATSGATIRYTLDGSDPDENSTEYSGSLSVDRGTLVRARAFLADSPVSGIAEQFYGDANNADLPVPGASMWLRADRGVELGADGGVARWRDLTGNGNDLEQGTVEQRPRRLAEGFLTGCESALIVPDMLGNRNYPGTGGEAFVVDEPIEITALGAFDHLKDGFAGSITVQLWSRDDAGTILSQADDTGIAMLAEVEFTNAAPGTLDGVTRFKELPAPLTLQPGSYMIMGWGYTGGDFYREDRVGTRATDSDRVRFVGTSQFNPNPGVFPTTAEPLFDNNGGVNFKFQTPGVQPGSTPVIHFDGVEDGLWGRPGMDIERPSTVFLVTELVSETGLIIQNTTGAHYYLNQVGFRVNNAWVRNQPFTYHRPYTIGMVNLVDGSELLVDGQDWTQDPTRIGAHPGRIALGGGNGRVFDPIEAKIAEVLVYPRALDEGERWLVESYLAKRYETPARAVNPPSFSPEANVGTGEVEVTLTTTTPGARTYYELDGSVPDESSMLYGSPFSVPRGTTVRARSFLDGSPASATAEVFYEDAATTELPINDPLVWLRADRGVERDAAGYVSRWRDLSGNGHDFEQGTDFQRPYWSPSGNLAKELAVKVSDRIAGHNWAGSLGVDFVVEEPIEVSHLAAYDHLGDGFEGDITVQLWSRDDGGTSLTQTDDGPDTLLATASFSSGAPGVLVDRNVREKSIDPVVLQPGAYTIYGWGYNSSNRYLAGVHSSGSSEKGIRFVGVGRFGAAATPGSFPTSFASATHFYNGTGNFRFQRVGEIVPEFPVVTFDGVDDGLQALDAMNADRPSSVFLAFEITQGSGRVLQNSAGNPWYISEDGIYAGRWVRTFSFSQDRCHLVQIDNSETGTDVFINGMFATNDPAGLNTNPGRLALGGGNGARFDPIGIRVSELLVFDRVLSDSERWEVEAYLSDRYRSNATPVTTPVISPDDGVGVGEVEVSLSAATPGAEIRYTLDGTEPTEASTQFVAPFNVARGTKVRARAFLAGAPRSGIAEAYYGLEGLAELPVVDPSLWLRADRGVSLDAQGRVSKWQDLSGQGNHAERSPIHEAPRLERNAIGSSHMAFVNGRGQAGRTPTTRSIATDFAVTESIAVTHLGVFDHLADGLAGAITVELWERNDQGTVEDRADDTGTLLSARQLTRLEPGELEGSSRFVMLAEPLVLAPGTYTVAAHGFAGADLYDNTQGGSASSKLLIEGARDGAIGGEFPEISRNSPAYFAAAGTFKFRNSGEESERRAAVRFDGSALLGPTDFIVNRPSTVIALYQVLDGLRGRIVHGSPTNWLLGPRAGNESTSQGYYANGWVSQHLIPRMEPSTSIALQHPAESAYLFNGEDLTQNPFVSGNLGRYGLGGLSVGQPVHGDLAELLIYDRVLDEGELQRIQSYLAQRYHQGKAPLYPPEVTPRGGLYTASRTVRVSHPIEGVKLRYTMDGSEPTESSPIFPPALSVDSNLVLKVRAFHDEYTPSDVAEANFFIDGEAPEIPQRSAMQLWLRAGVGEENGGAGISRWFDLSGQGHNAVQDNADLQPVADSSAIGGAPGVLFDGANDYLNLPQGFRDFTQGLTALFVIRPDVTGNYPQIVEFGRGQQNDTIHFGRHQTSENFYYSTRLGTGFRTRQVVSEGFLNMTNQLVSVTQGADGILKIFVNGTLALEGDYVVPRNLLRTSNFVGNSNTGSVDEFSGHIGEIMVFDRALTDLERELLEQSVRERYGISTSSTGTVTFDPAPGFYTGSVAVSMSSTTPNARIYYTLDGSEPDESSSLYSDPLTLTSWTQVRARALADELNPSQFSEAVYVLGQPPAGGDGLLGTYFDNADFTGSSLTRVDPMVNFVWGHGSPDPAIEEDHFSVRWTGKVMPRFTEDYTFYTVNDDGVRLWIDLNRDGSFDDSTELLIDDWTAHGAVERSSVPVSLQEGELYDLKLEYFENTSAATVRLRWSTEDSQPKEEIPQSQLFSNAQFSDTVITPTITPPGGTYNSAVEVSISTSTPGAAIYYTMDGSEPTQTSAFYTEPFTVGVSATIKARGFRANYNPSGVATTVYDIDAVPPHITEVAWNGAALNGGEILTGPGVISALATDNQGISRAEFYYQPAGNPNRVLLATDTFPSNGLTGAWDVSQVSDGDFDLWVRVFDTAGTWSEERRIISVALPPPPAPSIIIPDGNITVETTTTPIRLQSTVGDNVRVFWKGDQIFSGYPNSAGLINFVAPLHVGENDFYATAQNRAGTSEQSNRVIVTRLRQFVDVTLTGPDSIVEGGPAEFTVSIPQPATEDVEFRITVSIPSQIEAVPPVVIPAGSNSTTFSLLTVQDTRIEIPADLRIIAEADLHQPAETIVMLVDDDVPVITLELDEMTVTESAGIVSGRVTREPVTGRAVNVWITTSLPEVDTPRFVTIPAGNASVPIAVAVTDNQVLDGTRTAVLRGEVRIGSGRVASTSAPVELSILDDEGPTLSLGLEPSVLFEGQTGQLLIRRAGITLADPVTVSLSVDPDDATIADSVVIPAGLDAVAVPITAKVDADKNGTRRLMVSASAPEYTNGVGILTVTDETQAELTASGLSTPARALTGEYMSVDYTVENLGSSPAMGPMLERVFLSPDPSPGDDILLRQIEFEGELAANGSFSRSLTVLAPTEAGTFWMIVTVDAGDAVREISELNNTVVARIPITIAPAYSATVETDSIIVPANTPIEMSGTATKDNGQPAPFSLVNIHIRTGETERVIAALTNSIGRFSTTWDPLPGEGGYYEIGAVHPGVTTAPVHDAFTLQTLLVDLPNDFIDLREGETVIIQGTITNPNDQAVTGLALTGVGAPPGLTVTGLLPKTTLAPGEEMEVPVEVSAAAGFAGSGQIEIAATSSQGIDIRTPISVSSTLLAPTLDLNPGTVRSSALRGTPKTFSFVITNNGGLETGPLRVLLPQLPWLSLVSANPLPSILPGESASVSLRVAPDEEVPLTLFEGTMVLRYENGPDKAIPYRIRVVSELTGDLEIETVDELFYFTDGAPKLPGATVRIRDAITSEEITSGVTGEDGRVLFSNLTEGWYRIEISAPDHKTVGTNYLLEAGQVNFERVFLTKELIKYTWTVEEIEVEDRYRITVESTFETNVPVPVVTVEPNVLDVEDLTVLGQEKVVIVTVTNQGWIGAQGAEFFVDDHPFYDIIPMVKNLGAIPAKSSLQIPFTLRRKGVFDEDGNIVTLDPAAPAFAPGEAPREHPPAPGASSPVSCAIRALLQWYYNCGPNRVQKTSPMGVSGVQGNCRGMSTTTIRRPPPIRRIVPPRGRRVRGRGPTWRIINGSGPGGGGAIHPGGGSFDFSTPYACLLQCLFRSTADCAIGFTPFGCIWGGLNCVGSSVAAGSVDPWACLTAIPGCFPPANAYLCVANYLKCFYDAEMAGEIDIVPDDPAPAHDPRAWLEILPQAARDYAPGLVPSFNRIERALDVYQVILGTRERVLMLAIRLENGNAWMESFFQKGRELSAMGRTISPAEIAELETLAGELEFDWAELLPIVERWNRTFAYEAQGITSAAQVPEGQSLNFIPRDELLHAIEEAVTGLKASQEAGFVDPMDEFFQAFKDLRDAIEGNQGGVCSRVKVRLDQDVVMTRTAFRANLEVENERENVPLTMVRFDLEVRTLAGEPAEDLFNIQVTDLRGLEAIDGSGEVPGGGKGSAQWTLIPRDTAALTEPTSYTVGGSIHFEQGGTVFNIPLERVGITVRPDACLKVRYFHQRDVFSDDPHTLPIEPSIPYRLAVMVSNDGAGTAHDLKIISGEPQIVENEKGLFIDFDIIATEVDGKPLSPSLTADFGDVEPGERSIATWFLTSTLQGLFTEYEATFEHVSDLDDPRISLLKEVEIHEMIHMIHALGEKDDGKPDFLVNDVIDVNDYPDTVHLSDGTTELVTVKESAQVNGELTPQNLTITIDAGAASGWRYLRIPDPANGRFRLLQVTRSDGQDLEVDVNSWITDRTFIGRGRRPIYENILHLVDCDSPGTYTLTYGLLAPADSSPPSSMITVLNDESSVNIPVFWSGTDNREIARFDIFVSVNGGPWTLWLDDTTETEAVYVGNLGDQVAFYSRARDAAGNVEVQSEIADTSTEVVDLNLAPVITPVGNQQFNEGISYTLAINATDPDGNDDDLIYSVSSDVSGVVIDGVTGILNWVTGETDGGTTANITVTVTDQGAPVRSSQISFMLEALETNLPPSMPGLGGAQVLVGDAYSRTVVAEDVDVPAQTLSYSLSGAPAGMMIDSSSGLITFTPIEAQAGLSYNVQVRVTDNGEPPRAISRSLVLTVPPLPQPPIVMDDKGRTIKNVSVTLSRLLLNDVDPEGDPLELESVDTRSLMGGTIVRKGDLVSYLPPAGFTGLDSFTYRVRSTSELTGLGTVFMEVTELEEFRMEVDDTSVEEDGTVKLKIFDVPDWTFGLESSPDLENWVPYGYAIPGADGVLCFLDLAPPAERYYRWTTDANPEAPILESDTVNEGIRRLIYRNVAQGAIPFEVSENQADWTFFQFLGPNENGFLVIEDDAEPKRYFRPQP